MTVTVAQTATGFSVSPGTATILPGSTLQLAAGAIDQFGNVMATQPGVTWSVTSGGGTVNTNGLYIAPATTGAVTVKGTFPGGSFANASLTVASAVAFYKADASSGTTLVDSSGNNKTATLTGTTSFTAGVSGNALTLGGGNASLPANIVSSLSDFTIAAWVKVTTLVNWARVFDFGTGTTDYMFLTADNGATNKIRYAITNAAKSTVATFAAAGSYTFQV